MNIFHGVVEAEKKMAMFAGRVANNLKQGVEDVRRNPSYKARNPFR